MLSIYLKYKRLYSRNKLGYKSGEIKITSDLSLILLTIDTIFDKLHYKMWKIRKVFRSSCGVKGFMFLTVTKEECNNVEIDGKNSFTS